MNDDRVEEYERCSCCGSQAMWVTGEGERWSELCFRRRFGSPGGVVCAQLYSSLGWWGRPGAGIPVVVPDEVGPRVVLVTTQAGKSFLAKLEMLKMALRRVPVPVQ